MRAKRWLIPVAVVAGVILLLIGWFRVYGVEGASDAPTFLIGERVLVMKLAYNVPLPFTNVSLIRHSSPQAGDMVLYTQPDSDISVFKRVIGCPGDTIRMRDNHLVINGDSLLYQVVGGSEFDDVAEENDLGEVIEWEVGHGPPHMITFTRGAGEESSFGEIVVAEDCYFVLGDNRDNSLDSRHYGPVPRENIQGRVILSF
jgi:signal peptidase I